MCEIWSKLTIKIKNSVIDFVQVSRILLLFSYATLKKQIVIVVM